MGDADALREIDCEWQLIGRRSTASDCPFAFCALEKNPSKNRMLGDCPSISIWYGIAWCDRCWSALMLVTRYLQHVCRVISGRLWFEEEAKVIVVSLDMCFVGRQTNGIRWE
jgi:hypothetical protein